MQVTAILNQLVYDDCLKWENMVLKKHHLHVSLFTLEYIIT